MSEWMLEFENVSFRYPCTPRSALATLNLKVPQQKRCALIGQNGCGKTTFFLMAAGLYQPQSGKVYWQGQPFRYDRPWLAQLRQHLGLVFQNPDHQVVASTVEEDISYGLHNLERPAAEIAQRVQQAIVDFDLTDLAHEPIHHLSLGQKKRLSIADVMVLNPKLLLLDEPTAYLDPRHTRDLLVQLQQIHAAGTTILLASHDLDFVYRWADWVFVMDQGHLILEGTPDAVFAQRETLEQLQLGVPLAIELLEQLAAIAAEDQNISPQLFTQWQQQVLQARRLGERLPSDQVIPF